MVVTQPAAIVFGDVELLVLLLVMVMMLGGVDGVPR